MSLALYLIGCERSGSFLDQSQSVAKQISDYFQHSIKNCTKWDERPSFVFDKNIQLSLHLQVCLRKFKRLNWNQKWNFFLTLILLQCSVFKQKSSVSAVLVKLLQGSAQDDAYDRKYYVSNDRKIRMTSSRPLYLCGWHQFLPRFLSQNAFLFHESNFSCWRADIEKWGS